MKSGWRIVLWGVANCLWAVVAAPAALAADSMSASTALTYGAPVQENTAAFTIDPGEPNTTEPFVQTCGTSHGVGVARTAWFTVQGTGGSVTVATGGPLDTALFVYSGSPAGTLVTCSDDSGGLVLSSVTFSTTAGAIYAIQAGTFCSSAAGCATANGGNLTVLATAAPVEPPPSGGGGSNPLPAGGSNPIPDTLIASKPKAKTTNHSARIGFRSTLPGASFECSLDGAGYKSCVSPRVLHVGVGPHVFKVRSVASGGVTDPSPATVSWRVTKQKKHRRGHGRPHHA
jgi:hypothetical protein